MSTGRIPFQEQDLNIPLQGEKIFNHRKDEINDHSTECGGINNEDKHNVLHFRNLLSEERKRLLLFCEEWNENLLNLEDIEDRDGVLGDIRSVVGQAHLVMKERFTQFEGLVDNCEFATSEKPVTCTDLQGFWEMIFYQVKDVIEKFETLRKRKERHWITTPRKSTTTKKLLKKAKRKSPTVDAAAKARREEARKRLAAAKAALKKEAGNVITFDAGFFKVNSPLRTVVRQMRTPASKEAKKSITPSSSSFLHGRFLRKAVGKDMSSKKTLSFDPVDKVNAADANSNTKESDGEDKAPQEIDATKDAVSATVKLSEPLKSAKVKSAATLTEPYDLSTVSKSMEIMYEQMKLVREVQQNLQKSFSQKENTDKLERKDKSVQSDVEFPTSPLDGATEPHTSRNSYEFHYRRLLDKVKLLESELSAYQVVKHALARSKDKWKQTFNVFQTKCVELENYRKSLHEWSERLKEKENKEIEELLQVRDLNRKQEETIEELESKTANFNEISQKLNELTESFNKQTQEYNRLENENELIRSERNQLRTKFSEQCDVVENLQNNLSALVEQKNFEQEELVQEKAYLEEEKNMLHSHL